MIKELKNLEERLDDLTIEVTECNDQEELVDLELTIERVNGRIFEILESQEYINELHNTNLADKADNVWAGRD